MLRSTRRFLAPLVQKQALSTGGTSLRTYVSVQNVLTRSRPTSSHFLFNHMSPLSRSYCSAEKKIELPSLGDSISEGTLEQWAVAEGGEVARDERVATVETEKQSVDILAQESGVIVKHLVEEGDTVKVGSPYYILKPGEVQAAAADSSPKAEEPKAEAPKAEAPKAEAPKAEAPKAEAPKAAAPKAEAPKPAKEAASAGGETRVKMSRMRLRIAERLKDSQNTYALLTTFQDCDMSNLMAMRNKHKDLFLKEHGVKLGFMSAFVKASVSALQKVPVVNAVIDGTDIVYRDDINVSVAVATPKGLVVPVIRKCQDLSFADIERTIGELGEKAKKGGMSAEDMAGGTFTISNGGVYGSLMGTPIINPPQSAILGMHSIKERPVAINGEVVIRPMMYLALTYDHRLIDGRDAVTCLKQICQVIEEPERLLLDL